MVSTIVTFSLDKRSRGRSGSRNFIASFAEMIRARWNCALLKQFSSDIGENARNELSNGTVCRWRVCKERAECVEHSVGRECAIGEMKSLSRLKHRVWIIRVISACISTCFQRVRPRQREGEHRTRGEGLLRPLDRYTAITRRRIDPTTRRLTVRRIPRSTNPLILPRSPDTLSFQEGEKARPRMGQHVGKRNHGMDTPENNRQPYYSFLLNVHESLTRTCTSWENTGRKVNLWRMARKSNCTLKSRRKNYRKSRNDFLVGRRNAQRLCWCVET